MNPCFAVDAFEGYHLFFFLRARCAFFKAARLALVKTYFFLRARCAFFKAARLALVKTYFFLRAIVVT